MSDNNNGPYFNVRHCNPALDAEAELVATCERHNTKHHPTTRCPACSCQGRKVFADGRALVLECERCSALFGHSSTARFLRHWVDLETPLSNESNDRAFDFVVGGRRVHGWFNVDSKRVTQVG